MAIPLARPPSGVPVAVEDPEPPKRLARGRREDRTMAQSRWGASALIATVGVSWLSFAFLRYQVLAGAPALARTW